MHTWAPVPAGIRPARLALAGASLGVPVLQSILTRLLPGKQSTALYRPLINQNSLKGRLFVIFRAIKMLIGKHAVTCSTSLFLRRSAIQWRRSLILYSSLQSKQLTRWPERAPILVSQMNKAILPSLSSKLIRSNHDKPTHSVDGTSSSDFDAKAFSQQSPHLISDNDIFRQDPGNRNRFGILKAMLIIAAGIYFGAWCAMVGAYVLEELEIFVDDDDEDDD